MTTCIKKDRFAVEITKSDFSVTFIIVEIICLTVSSYSSQDGAVWLKSWPAAPQSLGLKLGHPTLQERPSRSVYFKSANSYSCESYKVTQNYPCHRKSKNWPKVLWERFNRLRKIVNRFSISVRRKILNQSNNYRHYFNCYQ